MRIVPVRDVRTGRLRRESASPDHRLNRVCAGTGRGAKVADTGLRVRFLWGGETRAVPGGCLCILGGDALVRIEVLSFGGGRREYDLHTGEPRPVVHEGFTMALVKLEPYPFSSITISSNEYERRSASHGSCGINQGVLTAG